MLWSIAYLAARRLFALVVLCFRPSGSKELEILVLRHEFSILRRQAKRPQLRKANQLLLAALESSAASAVLVGVRGEPTEAAALTAAAGRAPLDVSARQQAASMLACDFLTVETVLLTQIYVLFFVSLSAGESSSSPARPTRRALGRPAGAQPDDAARRGGGTGSRFCFTSPTEHTSSTPARNPGASATDSPKTSAAADSPHDSDPSRYRPCRVARGGYPPPAPTEPCLRCSHTALRDGGL